EIIEEPSEVSRRNPDHPRRGEFGKVQPKLPGLQDMCAGRKNTTVPVAAIIDVIKIEDQQLGPGGGEVGGLGNDLLKEIDQLDVVRIRVRVIEIGAGGNIDSERVLPD